MSVVNTTKSFLGSDSHGEHWADQERDENGRWTSGGAHSGSDSDPASKPGFKAKHHASHISWHDKKSPELEGMGAGSFRPFNVDAYHPKDVAKFSHDEAHTSYNQLMATARARLESSPKDNPKISVLVREERGFKDAARYAHDDIRDPGAVMPGFENHHTWPHSLGGSDHGKNLVWLTPAEHAVAHHLFSVMLSKEPKMYSSQARHLRDEEKTISSLKKLNMFGMKTQGETKTYSEIGAKINKSRDEKHVIGTHWLNEINNGFTHGKVSSYNMVEDKPAISKILGDWKTNSNLSSSKALDEYLKVSKATIDNRPEVNPKKASSWLLNGNQFGLEWAGSKFLNPKDRASFNKNVIQPLKAKSGVKGDPTASSYTYKEAARQLHLASVIAREYAGNKKVFDANVARMFPNGSYDKFADALKNANKEIIKNKRATDHYAVMTIKNGKTMISWKKFTSSKKKSYRFVLSPTMYVQKYDDDQPRDDSGRWSEGGGGGGGGEDKPATNGHGGVRFTTPMTATVKPMTPKDLRADRKLTTALVSRAVGTKGGNLASIYAQISHATGVAQGPELASIVDRTLKELDREGKIKVELKSTLVRHSKDSPEKFAGKLKWERGPDGDWQVASLETFQISIPGYNKNDPLSSPHTLGLRPHKFDPVPGSMAEKMLESRREEFPDTRMAPQGRFHSSSPTSPEMMFGDSRADLFKAGKISEADSKKPAGTPINGKYVRSEYYHPKDVHFYDATSSVTAHIGAMTGDETSLKMSKLLPGDGKPPAHHSLAQKLGVSEDSTAKPYFTVLSSPISGKSLDETDFEGFNGSLKKVAKAIWTPGSYGSKPHQMAKNVQSLLEKGGMKPDLAKATTEKMLSNFKETALYEFTPKFKDIMREAPMNFVYENPMSGFRMSFNKYKDETHRITLAGKQIKARIPGEYSKIRSLNGSAALFIQNWDSAAIAELSLGVKSPYTVHDAIGISKSKGALQKLNAQVARTMQKVQDIDPLKNLAQQIIKQHKANKTNEKDMKRIERNLEAALKAIRRSQNRFQFSPNNSHFAYEE